RSGMSAPLSSNGRTGGQHDGAASRHHAPPRSAGDSRAPESTIACTGSADARDDGRTAAIRPPARRSIPAPPGCLLPAGTAALYRNHQQSSKQPNPGVNFSGGRSIGALYGIEQRLRDAAPAERSEGRRRWAIPILDEMHRTLSTLEPQTAPRSGIGLAVRYVLRLWSGLTAYVDD